MNLTAPVSENRYTLSKGKIKPSPSPFSSNKLQKDVNCTWENEKSPAEAGIQ